MDGRFASNIIVPRLSFVSTRCKPFTACKTLHPQDGPRLWFGLLDRKLVWEECAGAGLGSFFWAAQQTDIRYASFQIDLTALLSTTAASNLDYRVHVQLHSGLWALRAMIFDKTVQSYVKAPHRLPAATVSLC